MEGLGGPARAGTRRAAHVLLLDPDPALLQEGATALAGQGHGVTVAQDAARALEHLAGASFDVVVADVDLVCASGGAISEELRRYPPQTVALVLTGGPGRVSPEDVLREQAYDHAQKPWDTAVFLAIVTRAAERVSLARAMRELVQELEDANVELRVLSQDLQRQVDRATASLRRKVAALDETNATLERLRRQRDAFIAMVAHDLATPLASVGGYAQLLLADRSISERQRRAADAIRSESRRMARLVDDLADAMRLESGAFEVAPVPTDLVALAREQVERIRSIWPDRTIRLETEEEQLIAEIDPDRIAQVVGNLLSNAMRYAPEGDVSVSIARHTRGVRISVRDSGPGIPPGQETAIFEPHVRLRAKGGITPAPSGSGLGLAIARGIVLAHGGRIWAESTPAGSSQASGTRASRRTSGTSATSGATFVVELPGKRARPAARPRAAPRAEPRAGPRRYAA